MFAAATIARPRPARTTWAILPLLLLAAAALLANLGFSPEQRAVAATDTVNVTATVSSSLSVADQCSGALGITVVLGAHADGTCAVQFGSTNDASVTLRAAAAASPFIGSFANEGATCANLGSDATPVDEAGLEVTAVGANVTKSWSCATGAASDNTLLSYAGLTTTAANVCATTATGTTLSCTLGVGVFEAGSNLAPGSYTGTINLDVIA